LSSESKLKKERKKKVKGQKKTRESGKVKEKRGTGKRTCITSNPTLFTWE
jgi:hypothetical protein